MGGKKSPLGEVIKEINDKKVIMDPKITKRNVDFLQKVSSFNRS